jgi:predicted PurR-regulated permease PerM
MVAADYPLLDVFWTMLIFFAWVAWFVILFRVLADIFRRHDIGGGAKTLWIIFVLFLPFLGVFVYLISQGSEMTQRDVSQAANQRRQFDDYVRATAAETGGPAAEIDRAKQLLDSGAISQAEFDTIKARALAGA